MTFIAARNVYFNAIFGISIFFWVVIAIIILLIFSILTYRKRREARREKLINAFGLLIDKAIFWEKESAANNEENEFPVPRLFKEMLQKKNLRKWFIAELVKAKDNLTGGASENLKKLYMQMKFYEDSLKKLHNRRWYVKVQGIRELNLIDQQQFESDIKRLTNHGNEYVRMEAQLAMIKFKGFDGLDFLDNLTEEITPWNQIRLLDQLDEVSYHDFKGIERWLVSTNDSVIVFALKLAGIFHLFDLEAAIISCLDHENKRINIEALRTLSDIYDEDTGGQIIKRYYGRDLDFKKEGIRSLGIMGFEENIPFLLQEWESEIIPLKMAVCKAVFRSSKDAERLLQPGDGMEDEPARTIINQVKAEMS